MKFVGMCRRRIAMAFASVCESVCRFRRPTMPRSCRRRCSSSLPGMIALVGQNLEAFRQLALANRRVIAMSLASSVRRASTQLHSAMIVAAAAISIPNDRFGASLWSGLSRRRVHPGTSSELHLRASRAQVFYSARVELQVRRMSLPPLDSPTPRDDACRLYRRRRCSKRQSPEPHSCRTRRHRALRSTRPSRSTAFTHDRAKTAGALTNLHLRQTRSSMAESRGRMSCAACCTAMYASSSESRIG